MYTCKERKKFTMAALDEQDSNNSNGSCPFQVETHIEVHSGFGGGKIEGYRSLCGPEGMLPPFYSPTIGSTPHYLFRICAEPALRFIAQL